MSSAAFDVLIIGGGCVGSAIFYELTQKRFCNVALVDQGRRTVSASAKSGGMSRVFHESPNHVGLALSSHARAIALQNAGILRPGLTTGGLYFFDKRRYAGYAHCLNKMTEADYPFELIKAEAGRERFPQFHWHDNEWAIYEPRASLMSPQSFCEDFLIRGTTQGGVVYDDFEVLRVCSFRDHYRVASRGKILTAKNLVLAGGARMLPLFRDLGLQLNLSAVPIKVYRTVEKPSQNSPQYFDRETLQFFGSHAEGSILSDPIKGKWQEKFWTTEKLEKRESMDCYAPGRQGFLGGVSGHPRLYIATGWGGTAFKFSLEIGRRTALSFAQSVPQRSAFYACV